MSTELATIDEDSPKIEHQVGRIAEKLQEVQELEEESRQLEEKIKAAERRYNAFHNLTSTIADTKDEYEQFTDWYEFANTIESWTGEELVAEDGDDVVDRLSRQLETFTGKRWQDFEGAEDISNLDDRVETCRQDLKELTDDYRLAVGDHLREQLEAVRRTKTALQIPDLAEDNAMHRVKLFESYLEKIVRDGKLGDPERWLDLTKEFEDLEIDLSDVQEQFDLSDQTMDHIRQFLDGDSVALSRIDETVLQELQTFEQFSANLTVKFESGS